MPAVIDRFAGPYGFLSNFSASEVTLDGQTYKSVEHAYQAAKVLPHLTTTRWNPDSRVLMILPWRDLLRACGSPNAAKALGRKVPLRADWEEVRDPIMLDLLSQKFSPGRIHLTYLLETGDAELIEGNHWHDNYWGNCGCCRPTCQPPGKNKLGQFLMQLRTLRRIDQESK